MQNYANDRCTDIVMVMKWLCTWCGVWASTCQSRELLHTVLLGKRHGGSQSLPCPAVTPLIVPSGLGFSMNVAASPELGLRAPSPSAQNCCVTSVKNYEIKIILFCLVRNSQGSVCVVSSLQSSWKLSRLSALSPLSPELRTFFSIALTTHMESTWAWVVSYSWKHLRAGLFTFSFKCIVHLLGVLPCILLCCYTVVDVAILANLK